MQRRENSKPSMKKDERKRGRPTGKNRVPLSLEERRARNAQYERERRNETAEAMAQLAEAACCDPQITNPELLATVIQRLKQNNESQSIEDLQRINKNLELQIAILESRLENNSNLDDELLDLKYEERTTSQSDSSSDTKSGKKKRPSKYRKISKNQQVHDARPSSSSSHSFSTDSQDSVWANHHLSKTLRPPTPLSSIKRAEFEPLPSRSHRINSLSSEDIMSSQSITEGDIYYENSEQPETFTEDSSQTDLTMTFGLVPELSHIHTESDEQQNSINSDPFTDGDMAILEGFQWSDFINFEDIFNENQPDARRPGTILDPNQRSTKFLKYSCH